MTKSDTKYRPLKSQKLSALFTDTYKRQNAVNCGILTRLFGLAGTVRRPPVFQGAQIAHAPPFGQHGPARALTHLRCFGDTEHPVKFSDVPLVYLVIAGVPIRRVDFLPDGGAEGLAGQSVADFARQVRQTAIAVVVVGTIVFCNLG
jgi:hypothetical protein